MSTRLGAYVLDALEETERDELTEHLRTCDVCPHELERLTDLPGLLARVEAPTATAIDDPPELRPSLPQLISIARGERRARKKQLVIWSTLACLVLLVAAVGLGFVVRDVSSEPTIQRALPHASSSATDPNTGVSAKAELTSQSWGTQVKLDINGLKPPLRCQLVVQAADGYTETAGSWAADYRSVTDIAAATSISLENLASLDVLTDDGQSLVKIVLPR